MEDSVKTHKRKSKNLVDPGDLVSEKSLQRSYKILGQVKAKGLILLKLLETIFRERELRGCW